MCVYVKEHHFFRIAFPPFKIPKGNYEERRFLNKSSKGSEPQFQRFHSIKICVFSNHNLLFDQGLIQV